ncbi:expressed unknown protein [Seminavis robusta]|uniref:Uncharacterized protein n=1 Tax=Seminavis robusta TaxID=568900 RepID=A0A9N8D5L0_9STRA|nr:expressed unknown protein [Seminavis robusta]|eukprot:Sro6_g004950.1 n/a (531) ;mRNA; r:57873-59465
MQAARLPLQAMTTEDDSQEKATLEQLIGQMTKNLGNPCELVGLMMTDVPFLLLTTSLDVSKGATADDVTFRLATETLPLVLIQAMKQHPTNQALQKRATMTVCLGCTSSSSFHWGIVKQHGSEAILAALEGLKQDDEVCQSSISFFLLSAKMKNTAANHISTTGLARLHDDDEECGSNYEEVYQRLSKTLFDALGPILQALRMHPNSAKLQKEGLECLDRISFDTDESGETSIWNVGHYASVDAFSTILASHLRFGVHSEIAGSGCRLLRNFLYCSTDTSTGTLGGRAALLDLSSQLPEVMGVAIFHLEVNLHWADSAALELLCMVLCRYPGMAEHYLNKLMNITKNPPVHWDKWRAFRAICDLLARISPVVGDMVGSKTELIELLVAGASEATSKNDPVLFEDCTFALNELANDAACLRAMSANPDVVSVICEGIHAECSENVSFHLIGVLLSLVQDGGIGAIMPESNPYCCIRGIIMAMSVTPNCPFVRKFGFSLLAKIDFTPADAMLAVINAEGISTVLSSPLLHDE